MSKVRGSHGSHSKSTQAGEAEYPLAQSSGAEGWNPLLEHVGTKHGMNSKDDWTNLWKNN